MKSSIKQWHKSLLFSCVALALLSGVARGEPDGYRYNMLYVLNQFTPGIDDLYLQGVSFWTHEDQSDLNYEIAVYHEFDFDGDYGSVSQLATSKTGALTGTGEHTVDLDSVLLTSGNDYYVVLGLSGSAELPRYGYVSGDDGYQSSDYVFEGTGGDWEQEFVTWAITPITTNQGPDANIEVTDEAGNWSVVDTFVSPNTMTADVTGTDEGPYDMEITVTGGMNPIMIDGTITNSTSDDWDGLCIQLGYGLGEDFELATDGLSFAIVGGNQAVIPDTIPAGEGGSALFGIIMGNSNVFTARLFAVPEPSSFLLLAISGLAFLALGRRKR